MFELFDCTAFFFKKKCDSDVPLLTIWKVEILFKVNDKEISTAHLYSKIVCAAKSQQSFTCSKVTIETQEKDMKYVQS